LAAPGADGQGGSARGRSTQVVSVDLLGVLGGILVLPGLPELYARMAGASRFSGLAGMVLLAVARAPAARFCL